MLIYLLLALDLPAGTLQAIDKIRRGFLWKGRKDARGGHCLIAWPKVTRPPELGGLGISDLQNLGWALRLRWMWLQKTEPEKPWAFFPIQASPQVRAFFAVAITSEVGNGKNTCFWTDRCLDGKSIQQSFPNLFGAVAARARKRKVTDTLHNRRWIFDIKGALTVQVLIEYIHLWQRLSNVVLQPEVEDTHIWQFSTGGQYTTKSAYEALFIGSTQFGAWERIWKSWAPGKCKFFLWTAAHKRCWTADRLARKGLEHPAACPLCNQAQETIDHLLVSCVFARQLWFNLLLRFGLQELAPNLEDEKFDDWWATASRRVTGLVLKGLNSIIILGAWNLWNHRNRCVFDGASPSISNIISSTCVDMHQWSMAGAKGVSYLLALAPRDS